MKDLENHVITRYAPQWIQLGNQLNIGQCLLNIIQHDHGRDCVECCSRMLDTWLQENTHGNATWDILINAIDRLPDDLASMHIVIFLLIPFPAFSILPILLLKIVSCLF